MTIELINTGSELLVGRVLNRHQQWICRTLAEHGYAVARQVTVPDAAPAIAEAVGEGLERARLVITTGGLGPTSDDRTRDAVAARLRRPLVEHPETLERLRAFCAARGRDLTREVQAQARIPEGAVVLKNAHGTAPGVIVPAGENATGQGRWLVMLPGPPRELQPMVRNELLPWLRRNCPLDAPFAGITLRSTGIPESIMQARLEPLLADLIGQGLEIGYCARPGEVDVRLEARTPEAEALVREAARVARAKVGAHVYGEGDATLESVVVAALARAGRTLATAESCTGGRVASRITDVPGASEVFLGGVVSYSNVLKRQLLGVRAATLAAHGAVSEAVAREMAAGARDRLGADCALALTGIAGPTGGAPDKPVGTVFMALATPGGVQVERRLNAWDRETFKHVTSQQALEMLRQWLPAREATS